MADAWPQLARCFEAQWRGLPEADQDLLARNWARERLPAPPALKTVVVAQFEWPIWQVIHLNGWVSLLSVKSDWTGDAPTNEKPSP